MKDILKDREVQTLNLFEEIKERLNDRSTLSRPVGWSKSYEIVTLKDAFEIIDEVEKEYKDVCKTNIERIQSMTPEELATKMMELSSEEISEKIPFCKNYNCCNEILFVSEEKCKQCLTEWLQAESNE